MTILSILKVASAVFTIGFGLYSVFAPRAVKGFTGLDVTGPRGISEIRSILGGTFVGVGLAPLLLGTPAAYQVLAIAYFAIAVVRLVSMLVDKSIVSSNVISLVSEVVLGIILIW
jgi:uncharacterized membrane protein YidH (DUF202 family)